MTHGQGDSFASLRTSSLTSLVYEKASISFPIHFMEFRITYTVNQIDASSYEEAKSQITQILRTNASNLAIVRKKPIWKMFLTGV